MVDDISSPSAGPPEPRGQEWLTDSVRKYWWIVVAVPAVALAVAFSVARMVPYSAEVRAAVILPGDTENPGDSERPELMILDDLPSLVDSEVFAKRVYAGMGQTDLSVQDVQSSLDASRYSRILTVSVSNQDPEAVREISASVEIALPDLINDYLVADEATPATVNIIDPADEPSKQSRDFVFRLLMAGGLGALAGVLISLGLYRWQDVPTRQDAGG